MSPLPEGGGAGREKGEPARDARAIPLRELLREREPWLVVLAVLLYLLPPVLAGKTLYFRDLYLQAYPQRRLLVQLVREVGLPLWDPYRQGGQPFLAQPSNLSLYPTGILHFLLPSVLAFNFEIVLHVAACAVLAHLLARRLGLSPAGAALCGIVHAFCGYTLSLTNHFNRLLAAPYLPALLLAWISYADHGRRRSLALGALLGALQLLAATPETTALTFGLLLAWTAARPARVPRRRLASGLAALALGSVALAAVQVLPALDVVRLSSRGGEGAPYELASRCSLHPIRLSELVLPGVLGPTDRFAGEGYWGAALEDMQPPYILSIYLGPAALALALGTVLTTSAGGLSRRERTVLGLVLVACLLLSLGRSLPGYRLLYQAIPPLHVVRFPIKYLAAAVLPVALLAGDGFDRVFRRAGSGRAPRALVVSLVAFAGGLLVLAVVLSLSPAASVALQRAAFGVNRADTADGIAASARHAAAFALVALGLQQVHARRSARFMRPVFVAVLLLDLGLAGLAVIRFAPGGMLTRTPDLAALVGEEIGSGRLYRPQTRRLELRVPDDDLIWEHVWNQNTLNFALATAYGIPQAYHFDYDLLAPRAAVRLGQQVESLPWSGRVPLLAAAGVTLVLTADSLASDDLEPVAVLDRFSDLGFQLYRLRRTVDPAAFVARARFEPSLDAAVERTVRPGFDPLHEVVLVGPAGEPRREECGAGSLRLVAERPGRLLVEVQAPCDGYLYLPRPWAPGWHARVDGEPGPPVMIANGAFQAVAIGRGAHRVELVYRPRSLFAGALVSALAAAMMLAVIVRG